MKRMKETTEMGRNRTGTSLNPKEARKTIEGARSDATKGTERLLSEARIACVMETGGVGSLPESSTGLVGSKGPTNGPMSLLLDKLSERAAFERTGVRLYDALLAKVAAGVEKSAVSLAAARQIRDQELEHFHLVTEEMVKLGGDDTLMSPCADSMGVASQGLVKVVTDPRTSVVQSLSAILTAELTDNVGWELLIQICVAVGATKQAQAFSKALRQEGEHLEKIHGWLVGDISSRLPARIQVEFAEDGEISRKRGPQTVARGARRSSPSSGPRKTGRSSRGRR